MLDFNVNPSHISEDGLVKGPIINGVQKYVLKWNGIVTPFIFPVDVVPDTNGCWIPEIVEGKSRFSAGYSFVLFNREWWYGHRLSRMLNIDSDFSRNPPKNSHSNHSHTENLCLHHCDNPRCVRPDHNYAGSASDNMKDLAERHPTIRQRRSDWMKGNKHLEGHFPSEETKEIISEKAKEMWLKENFREMQKKKYKASFDSEEGTIRKAKISAANKKRWDQWRLDNGRPAK